MTNSPRSRIVFVALCGLALAAYPLGAGAFGLDLTTKIMVYAIFALSLVLLTPGSDAASLLWLLPAAVLAAAAWALVMGALSLRTQGVYFIMVTLAFAQMAYYIVHDTPLGGGSDGIYLSAKPVLVIAGLRLIDLDQALPIYYFTLACLVAVFGFLALLLRSRFGRALAGIKANEQRMRATGFSTYPYKLVAFVISGGIAGLAGFLFGVKDGFVNPELMSWHLSGSVLIMIILGGLGHLRGALVGAFAFALLQEFFKSELIFGSFAKHWTLGLGLTIIASVALLPRGLVGLPAQWRERGRHAAAVVEASRAAQR